MNLFVITRKCALRTLSLRGCQRVLLLLLLTVFTSPFFASTPVRAELTITVSSDRNDKLSTTTTSVISPAITVPDKLLEKQRQLYKKVNRDLQDGSTASFTAHHDTLKSYPLYPYLQYSRISQNIRLSSEDSVAYFLNSFSDVPAARILRKRWLKLLYRRQRWQLFTSYYDPATASTSQQCQYQYARYKLGQKEAALRDALSLWTVGKSQPKACDLLFKRLTDEGKITEAIAWQRYTLAILNHKFQLARYIERFFTSSKYRNKAAFYRAVDRKPARVGDYGELGEDSADNRALIEHGISHLARQRATEAMKHWARYRQSHSFDEAAQRRMLPHMVKGLHKQKYDAAALGYLNDNIALADSKLLEWQLRILLRANDWVVLKQWINDLPATVL
ncbi:MAG: hypothetical protein DRQ64_07995 [Gammaproteobacteria bacterium]|nr:MAG: hypothetical protein DRQ64_07995 [Gammaproteobacteria bacterium]